MDRVASSESAVSRKGRLLRKLWHSGAMPILELSTSFKMDDFSPHSNYLEEGGPKTTFLLHITLAMYYRVDLTNHVYLAKYSCNEITNT